MRLRRASPLTSRYLGDRSTQSRTLGSVSPRVLADLEEDPDVGSDGGDSLTTSVREI